MTFPATRQEHGLLWFWTDGRWTTLDLIAHLAALESAYGIIGAFDWAEYAADLHAVDARGRHDAIDVATYLLHNARDPDDAVRSMDAQSYVRWIVSESDSATVAARALLETTSSIQKVFDRGLPRLQLEAFAMASPGLISYRGHAGAIRKLRYLIRDVWDQSQHEPAMARVAVDVARQYVTDRSYALAIRVKAVESLATRQLALAFEMLRRQEENGQLVEIRRSIDFDEPVRRGH